MDKSKNIAYLFPAFRLGGNLYKNNISSFKCMGHIRRLQNPRSSWRYLWRSSEHVRSNWHVICKFAGSVLRSGLVIILVIFRPGCSHVITNVSKSVLVTEGW